MDSFRLYAKSIIHILILSVPDEGIPETCSVQ